MALCFTLLELILRARGRLDKRKIRATCADLFNGIHPYEYLDSKWMLYPLCFLGFLVTHIQTVMKQYVVCLIWGWLKDSLDQQVDMMCVDFHFFLCDSLQESSSLYGSKPMFWINAASNWLKITKAKSKLPILLNQVWNRRACFLYL